MRLYTGFGISGGTANATADGIPANPLRTNQHVGCGGRRKEMELKLFRWEGHFSLTLEKEKNG
jgi:hypothetical protein